MILRSTLLGTVGLVVIGLYGVYTTTYTGGYAEDRLSVWVIVYVSVDQEWKRQCLNGDEGWL